MLRSKHASYQQISSDVELHNIGNASRPIPIIITEASWRARHFKGWRFGVLSGAMLATAVLLLNMAVTFTAVSKQKTEDSGRRILFEGDCDEAERLNVVAHLLINAMSTLLLSASNYGMQCLSAPTRNEVDVAHAKKRWLDIGVLSVRNLESINPKRAWLWAMLAASSLPLHLLYNSAVFSTVTANPYTVLTANADALANTTANFDHPLGYPAADPLYATAKLMYAEAMNGTLDNLTASQCIDAYALNFQTARGSLILVTGDRGDRLPSREYNNFDSAINPGTLRCSADPFDWICGQDAVHECLDPSDTICPVKYKQIDRKNWSPLGNKVEYCLSQSVPGHCKVQFSVTIAFVVIAFNLCKALILVSIVLFVQEDPLSTMGDAVSSFLRVTDDTTQSLCLMSQDRLALWRMPPVPQPYTKGAGKKSRLWFSVVSRGRWWFCMFLYAVAILVCVFLFFYGIVDQAVPAGTLVSLPIGSLNPTAFIYGWSIPTTGTSGVISNVLIANLPQVILSMIYYTYNSLFTCFLAGREWSHYALQRKGMRISGVPHGQQRSTYTLQLPYKIAFPLMALSGTLHWLTSQSIFLVSVQEQTEDSQGKKSKINEFLTCGYSPSAILGVIILGLFMVAMVSYLGTRSFSGGMPIVATNSACISAMCHVSDKEQDADVAYCAVQWGVTDENAEDDVKKDAIKHCSFSSLRVRMPEEGELCAGYSLESSRKDR